MKIQNVLCLSLITLLTACGNPHLITGLTGSSSPVNTNLNANPADDINPVVLPTAAPEPSLSFEFLDLSQAVTTYDFESVPKNQKPTKIFSVINNGTVNATITNISQTTDEDFQLQDINQCLSVLVPKVKCDFLVTFKSNKLGLRSDTFLLTYINQDANLTEEASLSVIGTKTKVIPTGWLKASWSFNGDKDGNFGKSRVEDNSSVYVNLKNESEMDAFVSNIELTGPAFKISDANNCLTKILASSSCTFKIIFSANEMKTYESSFKLELVDETETLAVVLDAVLNGEKVIGSPAPVVTISEFDAQGLKFGDVSVGNKYNKFLEISNQNNQDLVVSLDEITLLGSNDFTFTGGEFPGARGTCKRLMKAGRCLVEVTFSPSSEGEKINQLSIKSSNQDILRTQLIGQGIGNIEPNCQDKSDYLFFSEGQFDLKDKSVVYPYVTSLSTSTSKLALKYGIETNFRHDCINCESILDAMILTRFNKIEWPKDDYLDAKIQVNVEKVTASRNWLQTEMLCIQNSVDKLCSGQTFDKAGEPSWYALLNKNFFNKRSGPVNSEFLNLLLADQNMTTRKTIKTGKNIDFAKAMSTLSIAELYGLSADHAENILRAGFLNVILVDDLKNVSYPRLLVTAKKDFICEQNN